MGYRSEVGYAIVFHNSEDRDKVLNRITPEQQEIIRQDGEAIIQEDRILFHASDIKWYTTREMGSYGSNGYDYVDAHDALIQAAKEAQWDRDFTADDENNDGIYSMGVFIRLGEDDNDTERDFWGENDKPDNFPEWYDLIDMRRELVIGW